MEKYNASNDEDFKVRATFIKEERCELVKHHLWVLWTDYFKVDHLKEFPNLQRPLLDGHEVAPARRRRPTTSTVADRLLSEIDDIAEIFWATKK